MSTENTSDPLDSDQSNAPAQEPVSDVIVTSAGAEVIPDDLQPHEHFGHRPALAYAIAVAGWLIPGLGHALLKMWGRAAACFLTVASLVIIGSGMRGNIFSAEGTDAFDRLGYLADLGTGCFYFIGRSLEHFGADVSHANGDYGTRFLATAGILNLLAALHAFEAARGHKA
jgi:hypothetical protein